MHRELLSLEDIKQSCQKIIGYTHERTFEEFLQDEGIFDATVRNIQIIGEAVRVLPDEIRALQEDIEWSRIIALRHLLVHHYFGVDEEIIWNIALEHVPALLAAVQAIVSSMTDTGSS